MAKEIYKEGLGEYSSQPYDIEKEMEDHIQRISRCKEGMEKAIRNFERDLECLAGFSVTDILGIQKDIKKSLSYTEALCNRMNMLLTDELKEKQIGIYTLLNEYFTGIQRLLETHEEKLKYERVLKKSSK